MAGTIFIRWILCRSGSASRVSLQLARPLALAATVAGVAGLSISTVSAQERASPPPVDPTLVPYASTKDSVRLPDGRMLHLVCMGQGSPVVVLTPGGNDLALVWNKVQPAVAQKTRVCSWERASAGLSSPSPKPQTVADAATDLQAALKGGAIAGPYVVVGHSRGSGESLLLKDREPAMVAGMVLVDPKVPGDLAVRDRVAPAVSAWEQANPDPLESFLNKCIAALRTGTLKPGGADPDHCLPPPRFPPTFPPELRAAFEKRFAELTPEQVAASLENVVSQLNFAFEKRDSEASVKAGRDYGNMPLIVLTAGEQSPPPAGLDLPPAVVDGLAVADAENRKGHDALARLSRRGVNRIVPGTTHMIPQIKPQVVIDAIDEVVDAVRGASAK